MTAFYMWRLMAMTFFGAYRGPAWENGGHGDVAVAATHGVKHPADHARARPSGQEGHEVSHGPADAITHAHDVTASTARVTGDADADTVMVRGTGRMNRRRR